MDHNNSYSASYAAAGVDITAGYKAVELMKKHIARTRNEGCLDDVGGFGGCFGLPIAGMEEPVLVSGTDGVGTKLKLAILMDKHDTIGIDCVAMCVNDIICVGAKPLFFLDYIACGKNVPEKIAEIVGGVAEGCVQAGSALIGGETAEHPGMMPEEEYDLAGFAVGIVDKKKILDKTTMRPGDVVIALPSTGIHSNGFSLCRKVFDIDNNNPQLYVPREELGGKTIAEALLTPTKIYVKPVLALLEQVNVRGISHITGGGFYENIPRSIPDGLGANIDKSAVKVLPDLPPGDVQHLQYGRRHDRRRGPGGRRAGPGHSPGKRRRRLRPGRDRRIRREGGPMVKTKIAVLVSGGGTNLQALIDAQGSVLKSGEIVLVVSNNAGAYALERARKAGIATAVVLKKECGSQQAFEEKLKEVLTSHGIELIVLAGFMTILTESFTACYPQRIINVHPSLIPSFCGEGFYGLRVHQAALDYGVKVTGATVHFVNEIPDGGKIIAQKAVYIEDGDTPETLQRRVMEQAEWVLLPQAAETVSAALQKV